MGMFDSIHCSYDLGAGFYNRTLQTKDLLCSMTEYWLSPVGQLYELDFSGTQSWVMNNKKLKWVKNGCHGKVRASNLTRDIQVYPSKWNSHYAPFPRKTLTIVKGKVLDVH